MNDFLSFVLDVIIVHHVTLNLWFDFYFYFCIRTIHTEPILRIDSQNHTIGVNTNIRGNMEEPKGFKQDRMPGCEEAI